MLLGLLGGHLLNIYNMGGLFHKPTLFVICLCTLVYF